MNDSLTTAALLSSNRALLGAVTLNLRGVTIDYNNQLFILRAYFDNGATDNEQKSLRTYIMKLKNFNLNQLI